MRVNALEIDLFAKATFLPGPTSVHQVATTAATTHHEVANVGFQTFEVFATKTEHYFGDYNVCFNAPTNQPLPSWECLMQLAKDYGQSPALETLHAEK